MSEKLQVPNFASESEEAAWWYANREANDEHFANVIREGRATRNSLADRSGSVRPDPEDEREARKLAQAKGLEYQAYLKSLLHRAIQQELEQNAA